MSFNLFATLKFHAPGVEAKLNSIKRSFNGLKKSGAGLRQGLGNVGQGLTGAALATAPIGLAMASTVKEAAKFEQSLDAVQAILRVNDEEMKKLANTTKFLGATTIFTSSEVNRGAQLFAQAGFTIEETMAGLPGVLNAAAAGEISVAQATNLVASNVKAFSLEASEATRVADILAETSALTNTTMIELGEGLKLSAAKAKGLGFTLAQTAAAIGVISNVGVKGTLAGTALRNSLQKLSKPSEETKKLFGSLGLIVEDTSGKLLPFSEIMTKLNQAIGKNKSTLEQGRKAVELFGIRGEVAFGAFREQADKTFLVTEKNVGKLRAGLAKTNSTLKQTDIQIGKTIPHLIALDFLVSESAGASDRMAKIKLGNFLGQVQLLTSAFNNLQIEIGALFLEDFGNVVETVTDALSIMSFGFRSLDMNAEEITDFMKKLDEQSNRFIEFIPLAQGFADGFIEGFEEIRDVVKSALTFVIEKLQEFKKETGLSGKDIGKFVAKFLIIGAILAPIMAGLAIGMFIFGQLLTGVVGIFQSFIAVGGFVANAFRGVFSILRAIPTVLGALAKAGLLIGLIKIIAIIAAITVFIIVFKERLIEVGKTILGFFLPTFEKIRTKLAEIFGDEGSFSFVNAFEVAKEVAIGAFDAIIFVVGKLLDFILPVVEGVFFVFAQLFDGIVDVAILAWDLMTMGLKGFFDFVGETIDEIAPLFREIFSDIGTIIDEIFGTDELFNWKDTVGAVFRFVGAVVSEFFSVFLKIAKPTFIILGRIFMGFLKAFVFGFKLVLTIVKGVVSFIKDVITGESGIGGVITTIKNAFFSVKTFLFELFDGFGTAFNAEDGFFSGLVAGTEFAARKILVAFRNIAPPLIALVKTIFERVKKEAIDALKDLPRQVEEGVYSIFDTQEHSIIPPSPGKSGLIDPTTKKKIRGSADANKAANKASAAAGRSQKVNSASSFGRSLDDILSKFDSDNKEEKPIVVKSTLECDGQVLARAVSKANGENSERQGTKVDSFKRGLVERAPTGTEAGN